MHKRFGGIIVVCVIAVLLILLIGPLDMFIHGFFCEEVDVSQIAETDMYGTRNINDESCSILFSPKKKHFAGFELYFVNQPKKNTGMIYLDVTDMNGKQLDHIGIDLSEVQDSVWYKAYSHAALSENHEYILSFSAQECGQIPSLMMADGDYLPEETLSGDFLIGYAYHESTFSFSEKFLISMFLAALCGIAVFALLPDGRRKKWLRFVSVVLLLTTVLSWNYMFNSMDDKNRESFEWFHYDTEPLVTGMIYAEREGSRVYEAFGTGYGLGLYRDLKGIFKSYNMSYITDDNWLEGYNREMPAILVSRNASTSDIAVKGYSIRFQNGEEYQIIDVIKGDENYMLTLDAERNLSRARNGSLDDTTFYDTEHNEIPKTLIAAYNVQYGLQGKIFKYIARWISEENTVATLNLICAILTSLVFVFITYLIKRRFNILFAACFYVTFWLSPWIVNFAKNLYWVEFTWFIPMAIGLLCAWKIYSRKCRILCYAAAFVSVTVRALCGYEYTSTIMLGLISFLLIDFVTALISKDRKRVKLLFRTTLIMGIAALAGFMLAICIHANLKGDGNIIEGIRIIIRDDLLRRTNGADLNDFSSDLWPSMNASVWEVVTRYFHFDTEIITGIPGNVFPLLCLLPLGIFVYDYKKKRLAPEMISAYAVFFLTSVSWFCLGKSHSYVHTFLNFVMWYFGFVQTCFYIILNWLYQTFGAGRILKKKQKQEGI